MIDAAGYSIDLVTMALATLAVVGILFTWALLNERDIKRAARRTKGDLIPALLGVITVVVLLVAGLEAEVIGFPTAVLGLLGLGAVFGGINLSTFLAVFVVTLGTSWGVLRDNGKWME